MNKPKTLKSSQYLAVYLGALKEPWIAYCSAKGKKPGVAIKEAVKRRLSKVEKMPKAKTHQQTREAPNGEVKVRFEILLTPSEKTAIEDLAELERCSQRRWIIDAIRAGLTREPQFSMKEIEALGESNYQLLAIGRNLNQVAKAMNEGKSVTITIESIERLRKIIDVHTDKASSAIRASLERWNIE